MRRLKAVLEGGLAARPENALIYATSNRRHLLRESFRTARATKSIWDTIQESLSLADRFGLSIQFSLPDKARYSWRSCEQLARQRELDEYLPEIKAGAERWAIARSGRSPRCAKRCTWTMRRRASGADSRWTETDGRRPIEDEKTAGSIAGDFVGAEYLRGLWAEGRYQLRRSGTGLPRNGKRSDDPGRTQGRCCPVP